MDRREAARLAECKRNAGPMRPGVVEFKGGVTGSYFGEEVLAELEPPAFGLPTAAAKRSSFVAYLKTSLSFLSKTRMAMPPTASP